ncbi:MAG: tRNA (pseudouridine(54)-N(1))-methyltransferase TrmY [Candidatus Aenigmarchaeota archaeon]|nr:tRNA (pseudouridine(54)-N(1))-methyltransferase TrmY [Candidatus Aenigmarchaeota archaeon]MDW8149514.1 tRNA (pseudouridine(54)-N(1))-methyltransferase TrmY [Candidatus Aenigmarchaeota archaeon]
MRAFLVFSNRGYTSGNFKDLMKAGRLDIVVHSIIHSFFLSNKLRSDVKMDIILNGPPDPPKHIEIVPNEKTPFSKKDVGELIKIVLWKYKKGKKVEALPGIFVEKKSFEDVILDLKKDFLIYVLDRKGKSLEEVKFENKNLLFVLGDHEGIPKEKKSFLKKYAKDFISLGSVEYFTSQCIVILNYFLDKLYYGVNTNNSYNNICSNTNSGICNKNN